MSATLSSERRPTRAALAPAGRWLEAVYGARWQVLPPATGVAMMALLLGALLAAPREAVEGEVQRLFYIHVPSALAAYLAFFVVFVASVLVLWRRDMRFDPLARAAAGVGVLFIGITLATGAIWGSRSGASTGHGMRG